MTSRAVPLGFSPLHLGGAGLAFAGLVWLLGAAPETVPLVVPVLAVALLAAVVAPEARSWETWGLLGVLVLSLSALGSDSTDTDLLELSFGVALLGYVVAWYGGSLLGGRRVVRSWTDVAAVAFFLLGGVGGLVAALVSGTSGLYLRSDLTCILALALYFPVREVCVRAERGPELVVSALLVIGCAAMGASLLRAYNAITTATELYEVVDVRVSMGEIQITAGLILALLWTTAARRPAARAALVVVVAALLGGLILAKSRGPWITAALGILVAGVLGPPVTHRRLVPYALGGTVAMVGVGIAILGNRLVLIGIGLLRRFTSISGAMTQDVSLLNRYAESADAMEAIRRSPVFGYGWGATIERFNLIASASFQTGFLHNGYIWLVHKVGAVGLLCFLGLFGGALAAAVFAARTAGGSDRHRAFAAAAAGILIAYAILALPSNPFAVLDQMLVVTLVLGLASGLWERRQSERLATS